LLWLRLPKNLQDIIARNFEAARNLSNQDITDNEAAIEERLKGRGMLFNRVDSAAFRRAVRDAGLYTQWKTQYPPEAWAMLQRTVGTLS
jgi:TRAP-type C4-dicarboxylate transport system substrate-binding protein